MRPDRRFTIAREVEGPSQAYDPYRSLLAWILLQSLRDCQAADPQLQAEACRWFARGECAWLCTLLDLDLARVQQVARAWAARGEAGT